MVERNPARASGFTLIEILAVVVIVGIVTAIAVVSLKALGGRSDQAQAAERLAGLVQLASENARMENIQYGLKIKPHHYEFVIYNDHGQWLPITKDPVLGGHDVPKGMKLEVTTEGEIKIPLVATAASAASADSSATASAGSMDNAPASSTALTPQIAILSTGEITPFTLRLSAPDGNTYILRGTANGQIHVVPPASANGPATLNY